MAEHLPTIADQPRYVDAGLLASYGVDETESYRRAADGVDFDFGDVGAARKAEVDRIVICLFFQTRLERPDVTIAGLLQPREKREPGHCYRIGECSPALDSGR